MSPFATTAGELQKVIAEADRVVVDPATLTTRQIVAGQEVPPDLVDAEDADKSIVGHEYQAEAEAPAPAATRDETPARSRAASGK